MPRTKKRRTSEDEPDQEGPSTSESPRATWNNKPPKQPPKKLVKNLFNSKTKARLEGGDEEDFYDGAHSDGNYDEYEDLLSLTVPEKPRNVIDQGSGRLIINKIAATNFKSYFGTQTLGPFHKNLTAIIGPNGSGKSNVIDALLFVFGFRSSKIRSKKLSSLIHSSAGRKCDYCSVEIYFERIYDNNEDRELYQVIDGTQFYVSRTAYADNTSKYQLNGKTVGYKKVEDVLRYNGIDLIHNRFLILQGEVEAISMMKPKGTAPGEEGMLEYLEEIIGTYRYLPLIKKFERRLIHLKSEASQQETNKNRAENEMADLTPGVQKVIKFLNLENDIRTTKSILSQIQLYRKKLELAPLENDVNEKNEYLREAKEKRADVINQIAENNEAEREVIEEKKQLEKELEKLEAAIRAFEMEKAKHTQAIKRANQERERISGAVTSEKAKIDDLEKVPSRAEHQIASLEQSIEQLKQDEQAAKERANQNQEKYERKTEEQVERRKIVEEEFSEKNALLNEWKGKIRLAEAELEDFKKLAHREQNKLAELNKNVEEAEAKHKSDSKEMSAIKKELPKTSRELTKAQKELSKLVEKEAVLVQDVRELRARADEGRQTLTTYEGGSKVQKALLKAKADGVLPGLIGRIGDLGAIDPLYDTAISTTCGALDCFLVETKEDGEAAIDFLRKNRLTRTSFHILSQAPDFGKQMDKSTVKFPAPRLFDLVRICDNRFRKIFYGALGDLIVVPGMDEAQSIDKQYHGAYRIVTYNGTLIDKSGSVAGGGKPITGRIGADFVKSPSAEDQKNVEAMEKELIEKETVLADCCTRIKELDTIIKTLSGKKTNFENKLRILEISVPAMVQKIQIMKKTVSSAEVEASNAHFDQKELDEKEMALTQMNIEKDKAEEEANKEKARVDEINLKIDNIKSQLIQKFLDEAETARKRRQEDEQSIAYHRASIETSKRELEKSIDHLQNLEFQWDSKQVALTSLNEKEYLTKPHCEEEKLKKNILEKLEKRRAELEEIQKKKLVFADLEINSERKVQDCEEEAEAAESAAFTTQNEIAQYEKQLANIELIPVPNMRKKARELEKYKMMIDAEVEAQTSHRNISLAEDDTDMQEIAEDADDDNQLPVLTEEYLATTTKKEVSALEFRIENNEREVEATRMTIDFTKLDLHENKVSQYKSEYRLFKQKEAVLIQHVRRAEELDRGRFNEFHEGFKLISAMVRELYQMMTLSGDATLVEKEHERYFTDGIAYIIRPPKKNWKTVENLSGGEKTLASLALVFALHYYRPTSLYVMDEIDAALDFRNVYIIGKYLKNRTQNAQFIIISLRNNMFDLANRLIGIYKVHDCTHNVIIDQTKLKEEAFMRAKLLKKGISGFRGAETMIFDRMDIDKPTKQTRKMLKWGNAQKAQEATLASGDHDEEGYEALVSSLATSQKDREAAAAARRKKKVKIDKAEELEDEILRLIGPFRPVKPAGISRYGNGTLKQAAARAFAESSHNDRETEETITQQMENLTMDRNAERSQECEQEDVVEAEEVQNIEQVDEIRAGHDMYILEEQGRVEDQEKPAEQGAEQSKEDGNEHDGDKSSGEDNGDVEHEDVLPPIDDQQLPLSEQTESVCVEEGNLSVEQPDGNESEKLTRFEANGKVIDTQPPKCKKRRVVYVKKSPSNHSSEEEDEVPEGHSFWLRNRHLRRTGIVKSSAQSSLSNFDHPGPSSLP